MAKRILIVDDDADLREALKVILAGAGYEVLQAADGAEAEAKLAKETVDLLILDVMMETDTRGFHLAYKIRQDPKRKDLPILMMTGIEEKSGVTLDPENAGDFLPVNAYMRKPVDAKELKAKIAELLA